VVHLAAARPAAGTELETVMTRHDELKLQLHERLWALTARARAVQRDLQSPHDRDWTERATERENDEVLEKLDVGVRAEAQMIRDALQRMETGRYGMCVRCARAIEAARLEAEPAVLTCRTCAEQERVAAV
jgi:RNA polymerase-binding transcription factor DksA